MPELPEVETVKRGLLELLGNEALIEGIEIRSPKLRYPIPRQDLQLLVGQPIVSIERRAKYLLFFTPKIIMINHLGMTGSWRLLKRPLQSGDQLRRAKKQRTTASKNSYELGAHDHFCFYFKDGRALVYRDPRRFGLIDVAELGRETMGRHFVHLGPEPLGTDFTAQYLYFKSRGRTCSIKSFIMDQKIVVGVGNIYASESLYLAGIDPCREAGTVSLRRWSRLHQSIVEVLNSAIQAGGSTISDFRQAGGGNGYFQTQFQVYDRENQKCGRCQRVIRAAKISGRSTFWCSQCQR